MRILIHSNAPWMPTGYGLQTRYLHQVLTGLGHEVAVSAFSGLHGAPITWNGISVLPSGQHGFGVDVLIPHALSNQVELIIPLMDFYKLSPIASQLKELHVAPWIPVDCDPVGHPDRRTLEVTGATPIAMSKFGRDQLTRAGFTPLYAPHMIDTAVFKPSEERTALRQELGIDDFFLIGICAANKDAFRKGWPEQFEAFRRFAKDHDDARLMVHSIVDSTTGFNLRQVCEDLEIADKVLFSDDYAQVCGMMGEDVMADWFSALDVLSLCSYAEGFGIPLIEAQACGTPVITTDASAMHELAPHGWKVAGEKWWNPVHRAWWTRPDVHRIAAKYAAAYREKGTAAGEKRRALSTAFAQDYSLAEGAVFWDDVMEHLR